MCKAVAGRQHRNFTVSRSEYFFLFFWCSYVKFFLQGKSSGDEDTGLYGMGQLFTAMLTAYMNNQGYIRLATQQHSRVFKYDNHKDCAEQMD